MNREKDKERNMDTKKKGIGKWIVIAVVAIVIIAAAMGNTGEKDSEKIGTVQDSSQQTVADNKDNESSGDEGQSDSSSKVGEEVSSDTEKEDLSDEEKEDSSDEEKETDSEEESGRYHPGDIVSYGDFEITYKSVGKYKSNNQFIQPKKGFQYIKFDLTFKNTGDTDTMIGSFDCYADGEKCDQEYFSDAGEDFLLKELSGGRKTSGSVVFEVPKSAKMKDIELEYENYSFVSNEKVIFVAK